MLKRFFVATLLAFAGIAQATSLVPIQLLNPAGSVSGQAIVSTGPSTAPGWFPVLTGAGGTLTGSLTLAYPSAAFAVNDTSGTGQAQVNFYNNGSNRWQWSNASSSNVFTLNRMNGGTTIDSPFGVSYSTGIASFANGFNANSSSISTTNALFTMNDSSGTNRASVNFSNAGTARWQWSNASSNNIITLNRMNGGTTIDSPIGIDYSTGVVAFADGMASSTGTFTGAVSTTGGSAPSPSTSSAYLWKNGGASQLSLVNSGYSADNRIMDLIRDTGSFRIQFANDAYNAATTAFSITGGYGLGVTGINMAIRPTWAGATPWDSANLASPASLTGATFSGDVQVGKTGPVFKLNDTSGTTGSAVDFLRNGALDWALNSLGNGDFAWRRYIGGGFIDNPISISNANGQTTLSVRPTWGSGATPWDSANLASPASLTGATFTGDTNLAYATPQLTLNDTSASTFSGLRYAKNGTIAWNIYNDSPTNTINFLRFVNGVATDSPMTISNSTGLVSFNDGLTSFNDVTLGYSNPAFNVNDTSGTNKSTVNFYNNSTNRWRLSNTSSTNAFTLDRMNGATLTDSPISTNYSTGLVTFADGVASTSSSNAISGGTINNASIGATTASTGKFTTLQATSTITPSTTAGIVGTTLADNANAGSVGEVLSVTGTATPMTSNTATNLASLSLTPGDWDCQMIEQLASAAGTIISSTTFGPSTTSATLPAFPGSVVFNFTSPAGAANVYPGATVRLNVSSTTTVYAVGYTTFTVSTLTGTAFLRCRRVR